MMSKEPKKVILIEGPISNTLQVLAAAYGAGLVKQGKIAGEYPPPPVDVPNITATEELTREAESLRPAIDIETVDINGDPMFSMSKPGGGTVTGRWTHNKPPFHELYGGKPAKMTANLTADQQEALDDLAEVDWSQIENRVLTWWAGKSKPAPRVVAKVNLKDMLAQAKVADEMMAEWEAVLIADGYTRGTGACHDEWTKTEDPDATE